MENDITVDNVSYAYQIKKGMYLVIKRIIDLFFGLIGMVLLLPITIIIKILYISSGDFNSVFYTQERIGKNGKHFKLYKYRTMVMNADELLEKILKENKEMREEYRVNKKLKHDPRITKFGHIIRKLSIDEFPQFINVFLGQMSLVGNRPYLPREKEDMGEYYEDIVKTKPGITGLWQVSGRSDVSFQRRLELEREYSKHYSLRLDLKIIFHTFSAVFKGNGAM